MAERDTFTCPVCRDPADRRVSVSTTTQEQSFEGRDPDWRTCYDAPATEDGGEAQLIFHEIPVPREVREA